tara:strand:+ start:131069 stop:132952 length:1884 start_codon:yes stop_codon:yes gene_type:complete
MNVVPALGQSVGGNNQELQEIADSEKWKFKKNVFLERPASATFDVTYYKLTLTINPDTFFIAGSVTVFFVPNQKLNEITFDLNSVLTVDSVTYQGGNTPFTHADNVIGVPVVLLPNSLDSVTIFYHGQPPANGSSFVKSSHNGSPIIWTLSEPYGASDWWPHKESLTDKADSLDMLVTAPVGNKIAGNGVLVEERITLNTIRSHWRCRYPIVPYLVAFSVTNYSEIQSISDMVNGSLMVQNYVYVEDSAAVVNDLMATDTLLRFYDSLIGPYPFMDEKYGHAQFGWGGGMEHQTMSFMYHFSFGLTAHEMAHQWFGDMITCGSWQDIWLNEGFATYFTGLPLEALHHPSEWLAWRQKNLERSTSEPDGSVFVYDTTDVSRIFNPNLSYAKGAYVLHMLRKQIGDTAFFKGIRTYADDASLKYKTALTPDLFRHMEAAGDTSLTVFMNQWIYGKGYPSYNLEWEQIGNTLSIKLAQTTSHSSVPFFYLNVPILLVGDGGEQKIVKLNHVENGQSFHKLVDFNVVQIVIDPEMDIISKANFVINKSSFTELVVYPNPTTNQIQVVPAGQFTRITGYKIITLDGKLISKESDVIHTTPWSINLSQVAQGNYQLILYSGNTQLVKKVMIIR